MNDRLLAALAALEESAGDVAPAEVTAVVTRLGAVLTQVGARLGPARRNGDGDGPDELLTDVAAAARLAHRSVSWMRKHGQTVPGFCQPGGHGTKVGWWRRPLTAWANGSC